MDLRERNDLLIDTIATCCAQLVAGGFEEQAIYLRTESLASGIKIGYFSENAWNEIVNRNIRETDQNPGDFTKLLI